MLKFLFCKKFLTCDVLCQVAEYLKLEDILVRLTCLLIGDFCDGIFDPLMVYASKLSRLAVVF